MAASKKGKRRRSLQQQRFPILPVPAFRQRQQKRMLLLLLLVVLKRRRRIVTGAGGVKKNSFWEFTADIDKKREEG